MTLLRIVGWVVFALLTAAGVRLMARRVLSTPPGRSRWLVIDGAVLALLAPVDIAVWLLTGGGFFWPVFSITGLSLIFGAHVWYVARTPDPTSNALTRRVASLTRTRREALDAQADELRRIERDLHDGTQARLVSLALDLGLAESLVRRDPDAAVRMLAEARQAAGGALDDLRAVMQGIRPGVLADRGLVEGVRALVCDLAVPVDVTGSSVGGLSPAAEQATYFAVAEALANVVKHADAARAWVRFEQDDDSVRVLVGDDGHGDDGHGGADPSRGTGLRGTAARLAPYDGTLDVTSPVGGPTELVLTVPVGTEPIP
ncbi:MAG: putative two-component system sensor kinase [Nocardioidaceae bacterium]|nr:putative two-component system sensor kinase [Nocardioidaceae bacterium]